MLINRLLEEKNMSKYSLAMKAKVPQSTILDICSGKANLNDCKAGTLYKIANVLGTSVDKIIEDFNKNRNEERYDFDIFRSNICHELKEKGKYHFMLTTVESDRIRKLFNKKWYPEALYVLSMLDYLCRIENLCLVKEYDDIRQLKLDKPVYPGSVIVMYNSLKDERVKKEARKNAIPEFMSHNIVEGDIFDVA